MPTFKKESTLLAYGISGEMKLSGKQSTSYLLVGMVQVNVYVCKNKIRFPDLCREPYTDYS